MKDWMSQNIEDSARLCDIIFPGSHDAGMYMMYERNGINRKVKGNASIITQEKTIYEQLLAGYRMLDVRVYKCEATGALHCGHFPELTGKGEASLLGGFGVKLEELLDQIRVFLSEAASASECIILKLSHIKDEHHEAIVKMVRKTLGDLLFHKPNTPRKTLGLCPFRKLKGRIVCIVEAEFGYHTAADDLTLFVNPKGETRSWNQIDPDIRDRALVLRGESALMQDITDIRKFQKKKMEGWQAFRQNIWARGDLGQIYWTSTFQLLKNPTAFNIRRNTEKLWSGDSIRELRMMIRKYKPNVVITDFADENKSRIILMESGMFSD